MALGPEKQKQVRGRRANKATTTKRKLAAETAATDTRPSSVRAATTRGDQAPHASRVDAEHTGTRLGDALREARAKRKWTLRDVASRSDFNSGYLSLLERGEVRQPGPNVLRRIAHAYDEPFEVLMLLAGYIEEDPDGLSLNQRRALSLLGPDPSEDELEALKTILDMLRKGPRAGFASVYNLALDAQARHDIRRAVLATLREADAIGTYPTPLEDILEVANLVAAGEIELSVEDRRKLRAKFGDVAMRVLRRLQGVIDFRSDEVWVNPDLHPMKQRFVTAHEAGHKLLDWQRDTFAFLDDGSRLRPDVKDLYERQANEAAIELLTQAGRLCEEADGDNPPSIETVQRLSARYGASVQATARYIAERSERACACAISFKNAEGQLRPHFLFCSAQFERRLSWKAGRAPTLQIDAALCSKSMYEQRPPWTCTDVRDRQLEISVAVLDMPGAAIAWFGFRPKKLVALRG